jgi:prolyl-tRNA synthetase
MGARVLDQAGKEVAPIMGSYGIGVERILTSSIEQSNDEDGFWLPRSIAPFDVVVTPTNMSDATLRSTGTELAGKLTDAGFDVLLDDRDDRAGVKFKDADLVGIPYRVNVGKKVSEGKVELVRRSTRESVDASIAEIPARLQEIAKTEK